MTSSDPLKSITLDSGLSRDHTIRKRTSTAKSRQRAWALSLAGTVPFVVLAIAIVFLNPENPQHHIATDALKTYSAVVLSFLGGTRWGFALRPENEQDMGATLAKALLPAIVGWISLILPFPYVFGVLALAFAGMGAWDSFAGQRGVFGLWYASLRTVTTLIVTGALVVAFFATA